MQFESFAEFIAMGKHGVFVWSSYAAFVVVIAVNIIAPTVRRRQLLKRLQRISKRETRAASVSTAPNIIESE